MNLNDILNNQVMQILVVLIAVAPVQLIANHFIDQLVRSLVKADRYETKTDEKKREDTIITVFRALFAIMVWAVAIVAILTIMNVNLAALITGAGVFGVVFGLGAQSTIKDYLAGTYILLENQYRVGDIVSVSGGTIGANGASGVVEEITLRITRLRDQDGKLSIVRNGDPGIIVNRTFKYASVVIDLNLTYDCDVDKVEKLINKVGQDIAKEEVWDKVITEPIAFLRVDNFTDQGVTIKVIGKVKPAAQWRVAGEFRRRIKQVFADNDITFATSVADSDTPRPKSTPKP